LLAQGKRSGFGTMGSCHFTMFSKTLLVMKKVACGSGKTATSKLTRRNQNFNLPWKKPIDFLGEHVSAKYD
jgi:hypothetical protein